jgi:hypothetical protein
LVELRIHGRDLGRSLAPGDRPGSHGIEDDFILSGVGKWRCHNQ